MVYINTNSSVYLAMVSIAGYAAMFSNRDS